MCIIHVNFPEATIIDECQNCLNTFNRSIFHMNLNLFPKQIGIVGEIDKPQSDKMKNTKHK